MPCQGRVRVSAETPVGRWCSCGGSFVGVRRFGQPGQVTQGDGAGQRAPVGRGSAPARRATAWPHTRPWHQPMPARVSSLTVRASRAPRSVTASRIRSAVTSSQRHTLGVVAEPVGPSGAGPVGGGHRVGEGPQAVAAPGEGGGAARVAGVPAGRGRRLRGDLAFGEGQFGATDAAGLARGPDARHGGGLVGVEGEGSAVGECGGWRSRDRVASSSCGTRPWPTARASRRGCAGGAGYGPPVRGRRRVTVTASTRVVPWAR